MEVLAETEYQNIYRIKDGVLLVINKFVNIDYSKYTNNYIYILYTNRKNIKQYNVGCQSNLKQLKRDYYYKEYDLIIPKGTVVYYDRPVVSTLDKTLWNFQIKTTGEALSGNYDTIMQLLNQIRKEVIRNIDKQVF